MPVASASRLCRHFSPVAYAFRLSFACFSTLSSVWRYYDAYGLLRLRSCVIIILIYQCVMLSQAPIWRLPPGVPLCRLVGCLQAHPVQPRRLMRKLLPPTLLSFTATIPKRLRRGSYPSPTRMTRRTTMRMILPRSPTAARMMLRSLKLMLTVSMVVIPPMGPQPLKWLQQPPKRLQQPEEQLSLSLAPRVVMQGPRSASMTNPHPSRTLHKV